MTKAAALEGFEHASFEPVGISYCEGKLHEFHFHTYLSRLGIALEFQRILSCLNDGVVAADSTRHFDRVPQPYRKRRAEPDLGRRLHARQPFARHLFRRGARQRVRGVPLDSAGNFFLPLWTDFSLGPEVSILDWYTILIALAALRTLLLHGGLWAAYKTSGALEARASLLTARLWWP